MPPREAMTSSSVARYWKLPLNAALKGLGLAAELGGGAGFVLSNRNRSELGPIHALERHKIGSGVDHGADQLPVPLLGLGYGGGKHRISAVERDRCAVGTSKGIVSGTASRGLGCCAWLPPTISKVAPRAAMIKTDFSDMVVSSFV